MLEKNPKLVVEYSMDDPLKLMEIAAVQGYKE
jgi:hypothetical protein